MPLFEYVCNDCSRRFETLVRTGEAPACPGCQGQRLERVLSAFAVGNRAGAEPAPRDLPSGCHSCGDPRGPGACRN